jgi:hypothetical protein
MSSSGVIFMKPSSTSQCIQYGTYRHADSQEFLEMVDDLLVLQIFTSVSYVIKYLTKPLIKDISFILK